MTLLLKTQRFDREPVLAAGVTVTVADYDGPVDVVVSGAQPVRDGGRWVHGLAGTRPVAWWATW